jgi:molybdenum cofactor cytidylyltransferase
MKFGPVPTAEALGAILAHSMALEKGRLRKGRVLTGEDIAALLANRVETVTVARLEPGDMGEDAAARRLAEALVEGSAGLTLSRPFTGRVNILAETPGLARLDVDRLHGVNAVEDMITLATVPPLHRMEPGGMVATVKIISYGVPGAAVERAAELGRGAVDLAPVKLRSAGLILTRHAAGSSEGKGAEAVEARLRVLGIPLVQQIEVAHDQSALYGALASVRGEVVLILTASATSDIRDVAPAAVVDKGGVITRYGMPVDPGNLLFYGELADGRPVIGLPGCARSPKLNGADWVLERIVCGMAPAGSEVARMGVGGLLKEIPSRPQPRSG